MSESNEQRFYEMTILGCKRKLPICRINDELEIAAFIMFGDVEITKKSAKKLLKQVPAFDIIVTPEAKSIPLAYEMARRSGKPYIVARKGLKLYMNEPIEVSVKSITTEKTQQLFLSSEEADQIRGKRVLVVDDVISTGDSLAAVESLINKAEGNIIAKVAVLAEGDAAKRDDIIFIDRLPLIINGKPE